MPLIHLPHQTNIPFMRFRKLAVWGSAALNVIVVILFITVGLNYGIDFRGGTTIELRFAQPKDIAQVREQVGALDFGNVEIVEFGGNDMLLRIEEQPGGDEAQLRVANEIRALYGNEAEFRRVEVVGPRVSGELAWNSTIGVIVALTGIAAYIWFRFEWRFAIGALVATGHDLLMSVGFYTVTQLDFSLTSLAALLTIIGYSINDTVVVFDRLRENLRRFKKMPMEQLIDLSINEMLARTVMTAVTLLLSLLALFAIGGEVIRSFTMVMIWGTLVGTYSSIFIAAPVLIYLNLRQVRADDGVAADEKQPAGA